MARIELDGVSLTVTVRQHTQTTLKDFFLKHLLFRRRPAAVPMAVRALQDVSLRIEQGERLGVVGHNGAGQSTLLKMLACIYPPTSGRRVIEGRISSLFDITQGFETA